VGSKTFDGVWFISYSDDHLPPHVHGHYAGVEFIFDVLPDGSIRQSDRAKAVRPAGAKQSDARRILQVAKMHGDELMAVWEATHG
jgi:hypothetical protein